MIKWIFSLVLLFVLGCSKQKSPKKHDNSKASVPIGTTIEKLVKFEFKEEQDVISEETAREYLDLLETASPAENEKMTKAIDKFKEKEQARYKKYIRSLFQDIDTLGGNWTKKTEAFMNIFKNKDDYPKMLRAKWANREFLEYAYKSYNTEISNDDLLKDYSNRYFGGATTNNLSFYVEVKKQFEEVEVKGESIEDLWHRRSVSPMTHDVFFAKFNSSNKLIPISIDEKGILFSKYRNNLFTGQVDNHGEFTIQEEGEYGIYVYSGKIESRTVTPRLMETISKPQSSNR